MLRNILRCHPSQDKRTKAPISYTTFEAPRVAGPSLFPAIWDCRGCHPLSARRTAQGTRHAPELPRFVGELVQPSPLRRMSGYRARATRPYAFRLNSFFSIFPFLNSSFLIFNSELRFPFFRRLPPFASAPAPGADPRQALSPLSEGRRRRSWPRCRCRRPAPVTAG